jgi:hypothetical protein
MKKALKIGLLVLGCLMLLTGLVWIGQGTGYFPYPRSSFMISQTPWAYRGIGIAVVGVAAILVSRKL